MAAYRQQYHWPLNKATTSAVVCWLFAVLLVLAPSLGQIHRTLHGGASVLSTAQTHPSAEQTEDGFLHRLFVAHGPTDCLLLDQGTWAGPHTSVPLLPLALPAAPPTPSHYSHTAATRTAAFQARAPPAGFGQA